MPAGGAIPARTFIVPRRNNGPLLSVDTATGTALSVQYAGFSPTRELDAFRLINRSRGVEDFRSALQFFDVGSQNFTYADVRGNIAYFVSGEAPIREDLQAGTINGNPPYLLRNGTGGNEWLPVIHPQPNQTLPYEILPLRELPQVVNPPAGFIVTANNDPAGNPLDNNIVNQFRPGGGIFYLGIVYNGFRAGRITDMVKAAVARGRVTTADVIDQQADVTALDGQFFTPLITGALDRARRSTRNGAGRSGIDFFAVPGIADPAERRDFLILSSLGDALTLAASDNFAPAFGRSTDQSTYRWGKLHRITLASPIGAPYSIPSQGNRFTSPLPGLPGIPVDGGFNVPDVSSHNLRADTPDRFTVVLGPIRRFVAQPTAIGMRSVNSLDGGASEDLGSKFEQNLLRNWLTNDTYPVRLYPQDLIGAIDSVTFYLPGR